MSNWLNIKVKNSWVEGPKHVLYQLQLLRSQKKVLDLGMLTVRRSASCGVTGRDSSVRPRKTPDATCLSDVIDWSSEMTETLLTCNLMTVAVKMLVTSLMEVLNWPSNTQSVERCVKMVRGQYFQSPAWHHFSIFSHTSYLWQNLMK